MLNTLIRIKSNLVKTMEDIVGKNNVLSEYDELYTYSTDSTNITNPKELAEVVVFVENVQQVSKVLKHANKHSKPVIARAAGTNLCTKLITKAHLADSFCNALCSKSIHGSNGTFSCKSSNLCHLSHEVFVIR